MIKNKALASVILWSVISAAFIGPGTVTAAAKAGSVYQLDLLWALTFATIGCVLIQELSARLTIVTGLSIGEALTKRYGSQSGIWIKLVLAWPILLGCAAYEAGNILGAVAGLKLLFPASTELLTIIVTVVAIIILWSGKKDIIEWLMALMVALMGIAFIVLASKTHFTFGDYLYYTWVPSMPEGSAFLILGLVGTTIVPYNVFLGSGISGGQTVSLMRLGLIISIVFGGVISAAILVAGTAVPSFTNFSELSIAFSGSFGSIGALALGLGLFAAGFACVITSPFAASIIASSVFHWSERGQKITWMLVLLTGFAVGVSNVNPIVVIVAVQALNGLVLPLITAYLILLINDPTVVEKDQRASVTYNIVMILLFAGVLLMGLNDIDHSISSWTGMTSGHWSAIGVATTGLTGFLSFKVTTLMKKSNESS